MMRVRLSSPRLAICSRLTVLLVSHASALKRGRQLGGVIKKGLHPS